MARVPISSRRLEEEQVTRYILREHASGRSLEEILFDPYVRNRCSPEELGRIFEDPAVVHILGADVIAGIFHMLSSE
jgi:hypothetical protein